MRIFETAVQLEPRLLGQLVDVSRLESGELEAAAEALTDGVRSLSWAAYVDRVARMAGALVAAGVRPGDRVAVRLAKSVDSFVVVHAVVRAGAVMVPLDPTTPSALAATVLSDDEKSAVWDDIAATIPQMHTYVQRTDRNIRVFRLTPVAPT